MLPLRSLLPHALSRRGVHTHTLPKALPASVMEVVNATVPAVAGNLDKIVRTFYPRMFKNHPEVKAFFNMTNQMHGRQPQALANAVVDAVGHLNNLAGMKHGLLVMGHKHCALGVLPEHYQIVHDEFLGATAEVLGAAVTPQVAAAWSAVLMHIAKACIDVEAQLYEEASARPGNWDARTTKKFKIVKAVTETETVRSLYLRPADGSPAPNYTPGQYITLHVNPTSEPLLAPRHYTISAPGHINGCVRISVRRPRDLNSGKNIGCVAEWLHTAPLGAEIPVRPPFGLFTRDYLFPPQASSEVYITGGIGVTTAAAMMPLAYAAGCRVGHIHVGRSPDRHAFQELRANTHYCRYHYDGGDPSRFLNFSTVLGELRDAGFDRNTRFMVCGVPGQMTAAIKALRAAGVNEAHIHHEAFGPAVKMN
eukprot:gnl/Spiro4/18307_TR9792_c0_g1_i1.p1 gnl/Spiro4/18307_TR9792_c0_g1~~gnl/Spiro4/18307_TR9792_c0_g1_i1.p1  ORF type:complete len:432 (-),score=106.57 gnl/Spiro4/18307_TR9792_c0_g1_i1:88-1353(-)